MLKEAKTLKELKKEHFAFADTLKRARLVFKKKYNKWIMGDFKVAIQYKAGKPMALSSLKAGDIKKLYKDEYKGKKRQKPSDGGGWTAENERRLEKCLCGEIDSILEAKIYGRALDTQNTFLSTRLLSMSKTRRKDVLAKVLEALPEEEKKENSSMLSGELISLILEEEEETSENGEGGSSDDESAMSELESESELERSDAELDSSNANNAEGNDFLDRAQDNHSSHEALLEDEGEGELNVIYYLMCW
jgi:hypothetical protein